MKKGSKILSLACLFAVSASVAACKPTSIEKAKEKMKEEGYAVAAYQVDKDEVDGYVGGFVATKVETLDVDTITAVLFESKKEAKEFYEELGGEDSKWLQEGKWVFMGTEDAIEDFKD